MAEAVVQLVQQYLRQLLLKMVDRVEVVLVLTLPQVSLICLSTEEKVYIPDQHLLVRRDKDILVVAVLQMGPVLLAGEERGVSAVMVFNHLRMPAVLVVQDYPVQ
jgi:hypothetical protein